MPSAQQIESAVRGVKDRSTLLQDLLGATLDWPKLDAIEELEDLAYGWTEDDLHEQELEKRLLEGKIWQLQLHTKQPWGIFIVEFKNAKVYKSDLRKILRGLVPSRRRDATLAAWKHDNLLFLCTTKDYENITFAHFRGEKARTARLATFGWDKDDRHLRTLCEFNLPKLEWPEDGGKDREKWLSQWASAFDVEAVTKRFFVEYAEVFHKVEESVEGVPAGEPRRLYTQRLFNRLLFLWFIQRKGWLKFEGDKKYLRALFNAALSAKEDFLNGRLYWTFFYGLNTANEEDSTHSAAELRERRGEVPFLNGGLFDLEDQYDVHDRVTIPNEAFAEVFELLERYNFTVAESTPFDIEVAVDPEMLGKVFEELVTGRHESGSYYTPRPIVAFMCRESLKHYLLSALARSAGNNVLKLEKAKREGSGIAPKPTDQTTALRDYIVDSAAPEELAQQSAVVRFVDDNDPSKLTDPEAVLAALKHIKVCDPACGSGAYLLGMMQELLRLREALFAAHDLDQQKVFDRKLEIIQNNLYGVDIDLFAVNIAKLRLWLSLAVDFAGAKPPPLPNLDFKIECGDSLTAPNPQELPDLFRHALIEQADELADLKGQYIKTYGAKKKKLAEKIKKQETVLRDELPDHSPDGACDWRVAFAEVFKDGGFDIALENPPYVRMGLIKDAKPILRRNFPQVYNGGADLYVYFYARTHQILRPGGTACFITNNKWLKAAYAEPLRRFFAQSAWVDTVVDFGHAKQIFQEADVFPSILVVRKPSTDTPPPTAHVCSIPREQLRLDDLSRQVHADGFDVPRGRLGADPWALESPGVIAVLEKIRRGGAPLLDFTGSPPSWGILTGFNEAFLLDSATKERLVKADPKSAEIFKPFLRGQDINRWHPEWAGLWMLALKSSGNHSWPWARTGKRAEAVFASTYPAIHSHLNQFRNALINRHDQGEHWWELRACAYWAKFDQPKVMYQEIQFHPCYLLDRGKLLANNKVFFIPCDDPYLVGVLNSPLMWWYNWRYMPHMKDEALTPSAYMMEKLPIARPADEMRQDVTTSVQRLIDIAAQLYASRCAILDRLMAKFGVEKPSQKLQDVTALDADTLAAEVQKARGKKKPFSAAELKALNAEHARSVMPLQTLAAEARQLERRVADLVNAAYGLTPEEVALMWKTAPPRMPGEPPGV